MSTDTQVIVAWVMGLVAGAALIKTLMLVRVSAALCALEVSYRKSSDHVQACAVDRARVDAENVLRWPFVVAKQHRSK